MDIKHHKVAFDANTLYFAFKHNHLIIQYVIKTIESIEKGSRQTYPETYVLN
jgi:hypothetical protein